MLAPPIPSLVESFADQGWAVLPDFLKPEQARHLAADSLLALQKGQFRQAGVGRGAGLQVRADVRNDQVLWLSNEDESPAIRHWLATVEQLRLALNEQLFLGLFEYEGHFAHYPPGGFYKPHLDRHRDSEDRLVTLILYLNDQWTPAAGGQLRLWTTPGKATGPCEIINPQLGTLVCFLAGDYWHEVLPAHQPRLSITGWLRRRTA
jgi:SM-20-related protein